MREGWEVKKLGQVSNVQRGLTYGRNDTVDISENIVLRATNIKLESNSLDFNDLKYLTDDFEIKDIYKLKVGSLLICFSSGSKNHLGKVAIVEEPYAAAFGGFIGQITPNEIVIPRYLFYNLISDNYRKYISELTDGMNINNLKSGDLKQFPIPIPPIQEQKQIVKILDQAFTAIDQAKANIEKNIVNAKELFQSKLNAIFSQKGDGWKEKSIDEISKVVNGYSFKSKDFSADNEIKSIKITNVGIMEFVEDSSNNLPLSFLQEYSKVQVHVGDLVLALTRTIISGGLKVARVPESYHNSLLNQRVAAIVPNLSLVNSDYLYYYFSSDIVYNYVLSNVNTIMQPNLSIKDLKRMTIPITSLEGQRKFSIQIEGLSEKTNFLISNYEVKLNNIEELKKSILQKAFSGELTQKEVVV